MILRKRTTYQLAMPMLQTKFTIELPTSVHVLFLLNIWSLTADVTRTRISNTNVANFGRSVEYLYIIRYLLLKYRLIFFSLESI